MKHLKNHLISLIILAFLLLPDFSFAADPCRTIIQAFNAAANDVVSIEIFSRFPGFSAEKKIAEYTFNYKRLPEKIEFFDDSGACIERMEYIYSKEGISGSFRRCDATGEIIENGKLSINPATKKIVGEMVFGPSGKIVRMRRYKYEGSSSCLSEISTLDNEMNCLENIAFESTDSGKLSTIRICADNLKLKESWRFKHDGNSCEIFVTGPGNDVLMKYSADYDVKGKMIALAELSRGSGSVEILRFNYVTPYEKRRLASKNIATPAGGPEAGHAISANAPACDRETVLRKIKARVRFARICANPNITPEEFLRESEAAAMAER